MLFARTVLRAGVACIASLIACDQAHAICLEPSPARVCTEFFRTDSVIRGKVLSERRFPDTPDVNNVEGWLYKFQIDKTYRGAAKGTIDLYTGNDETHFPMVVGHSYLLFVKANAQGRVAPDNCGNSTDLAKNDAALKAVEAVLTGEKNAAGGDIAGRVNLPLAGTQAMSEAGAPGTPLTAHDYVGVDHAATTDQDGRFHMHVPAGHYTVTAKSDSWDVVPYALSYVKPDNFEILDGGCADLQFLAEPK